MKYGSILPVLLLVLCVGCSFDLDAISAPASDGSVVDAALTDSGPPDGPTADAGNADLPLTLDSPGPEAAVADMPVVDMATVDMAASDLAQPDMAKTDMAKTDMAKTDMAKSDQTMPDLLVPDAGPPVKDPTGIAISAKAGNEQQVAVASHGAGFMVIWSSGGDIFGSTMANTGGGSISLPFSISSATGTQAYPALAFAGADYLVVWEHPNPSNARIMASLVTTTGGAKAPAPGLPISDGKANQVQPAVACSAAQCLVVWQDGRNIGSATGYDIYGRIYDLSKGLQGQNDIAITNATDGQQIPDVAFDGQDFLVTWMDGRATKDDAYGARVSSAGVVLDTAGMKFSRSATAVTRRYTNVACDGAGGCLVVWMAGSSSTTSKIQIDGVITQSSAGVIKVTSTSDIVISNPAINSWFPDVAFSGSDYLVVWQYGDSPSANIAGARLSKAGTVTTTPQLDISLASDFQTHPAVARGTGQFLVTWDDKRNGTDLDVYGARVGP